MGMIGQVSSLVGTLGASLTNYVQAQASGLANWNSAETRNVQVLPCAVTVRYLLFACADPSGSATRALTIRKNLADTSVTCTVTGGSTQSSDLVNTASFVAGDLIAVKQATSAGVATSTNTTWAFIVEATATNTFPCMWSNATGPAAGATRYAPYMGDGAVQAASGGGLNVDYLAAAPVGADGTFHSLYGRLDTTVTGAGATYVVTVLKNGAATGLTFTINSGVATGNDTTHSFSVVKGDTISYEIFNNGTNAPRPAISMVFSPTTDGECPTCIAQPATHAQAVTRYNALGGGAGGWASAENTRQPIVIACTVKNLYFASNPADTTTVATTIRKNAADTTITQTVTGTSGAPPVQGNDTTHTASYADFDALDLKAITSATTGNVTTMAACVLYIAPTSGLTYTQEERGVDRGINRGISLGVT